MMHSSGSRVRCFLYFNYIYRQGKFIYITLSYTRQTRGKRLSDLYTDICLSVNSGESCEAFSYIVHTFVFLLQ